MKIDIVLNDLKQAVASSKEIGKTFENKAVILKFHLTENTSNMNFYLDIQKPDGSKYRTAKLDVIDNTVEYEVTNSLLDIKGFLQIEVVLQDTDNKIIKYNTLNFKINNSINATQEIEEEKPDFVSECQKVIDLVKADGNGDKYLSDDGTYKEISSGTVDYDELENQPMKRIISMDGDNPVILRSLESGVYLLHGWFKPYVGSNINMSAQVPIIVLVATTSDTSFIQLFFSYSNQVQYYEITDSSYKDSSISFNDLEDRIKALEEKIK